MLGPQRWQVYDGGATCKRPEKPHHEIDSVVRRQNAEVANARPKRIERSQRDALLQVILVRHHAALGAAAGSGGVHDASSIAAVARNERGLALAAKFFPTLRPG